LRAARQGIMNRSPFDGRHEGRQALSTVGRFGRLRRTGNRPAVGNAWCCITRCYRVVHSRRASAARIRSAFDNPTTNASAAYCTSPQPNTHVTESRVVLYPWHPWYGRSVSVFGAVAKSAEVVLRCAQEAMEAARPLEVPEWMFDALACCRAQLAPSPAVSLEVLLELRQLLSQAAAARSKAVLEAEHRLLPNSGGAHATTLGEPGAGDAIRPVSFTSTSAALDAAATRGAATHATLASSPAAPTSPKPSRYHGGKGGAR